MLVLDEINSLLQQSGSMEDTFFGNNIKIQAYTSVQSDNAEHIYRISVRIAQERAAGQQIVLIATPVVNKKGKKNIKEELAEQEAALALLASDLKNLGLTARLFCGDEVGVFTDRTLGATWISGVDSEAIKQALEDGLVPVIAGFQGLKPNGQLTDLGPGGAETVALAVTRALEAGHCEIFTDLDGVYTADPTIFSEARKLERIHFDVLLEMTTLGLNVIHPRAVWYAKHYGIPFQIRSQFSLQTGTQVCANEVIMNELKNPVTAVLFDPGFVRIGVKGLPREPGITARIFELLGTVGINADMISGYSKDHQIAFTVKKSEAKDVNDTLKALLRELGSEIDISNEMAKVSLVGLGLSSTPGIPGRVLKAISGIGANIEMVSTAETRISVVLPMNLAKPSVRAIHREFNLDQPEDLTSVLSQNISETVCYVDNN